LRGTTILTCGERFDTDLAGIGMSNSDIGFSAVIVPVPVSVAVIDLGACGFKVVAVAVEYMYGAVIVTATGSKGIIGR